MGMVLVQPGEGKGSAGLSSSPLHSYKVINKEKPGTLRSALGEETTGRALRQDVRIGSKEKTSLGGHSTEQGRLCRGGAVCP